MNKEDICTITRINGGWLVIEHRTMGATSRTVFCETWDKVNETARKFAHPYPNPDDHRGPQD